MTTAVFQLPSASLDTGLDDLFTRSISQYSVEVASVDTQQPVPPNTADSEPAISDTESIVATLPVVGDKQQTADDSEEKQRRTVFVGNVPAAVATDKSKLRQFKRLFLGCGQVESIRFRSAAFSKPLKDTKTRKYAFIHGELHPERDSLNAYVVFKEQSSVEKAVRQLNAFEFDQHHLRVDFCSITTTNGSRNQPKNDTKRSVFVGNLPFTLNEEQLWKLFDNQCGKVERVRLIRDKVTGIGKGFGYVQFTERSTVPLALDMDGNLECNGRQLRIQKCSAVTNSNQKSFEGAKALTGAQLRLQRKAPNSKAPATKRKSSIAAGKVSQ